MSFDFQAPGFETDIPSQNNHSLANETKLIGASRRLPPLEIGKSADMELVTDVDRAAATRRAVSRTPFSKAVPRGEGARSGVLPAYQTRGGGGQWSEGP